CSRRAGTFLTSRSRTRSWSGWRRFWAGPKLRGAARRDDLPRKAYLASLFRAIAGAEISALWSDCLFDVGAVLDGLANAAVKPPSYRSLRGSHVGSALRHLLREEKSHAAAPSSFDLGHA